MKFLINASNIKKSGALQVTLSFIEELRKTAMHDFVIVMSDVVSSQIDREGYADRFVFNTVIFRAPFSRGYKQYINLLDQIENEHKPDIVFTIFGPSYWRPKAIQLLGFAHGWAIHPDAGVVRSLKGKARVKHVLETNFKKFYFKRDGDYFVVETEDAKSRLHKYFDIPVTDIYVVSNTANHYFLSMAGIVDAGSKDIPEAKPFRLITVSSNFLHKNLKIIPQVLTALKERKVSDILFHVTISEQDYLTLFGEENPNIINLGTLDASDCPEAYRKCDALFLPTLLECFSASYPEAMIMQKPILTSDLGFAHSICSDAAIYFDPYKPEDIADKIILLRYDQHLQETLIENGLKRLKEFPTPARRAEQYISICESIISKNEYRHA